MSTANFYTDLVPFKNFADVGNTSHYSRAPEDWHVVLTDIKGSTKLVEDGRYRDVNYIGAATIIAVLNACNQRTLPFVFGGDGATLLIPNDLADKTKEALAATVNWAYHTHKIVLRASIIPVREIFARGGEINVAKYELAPGNFIAMFNGGGLHLAEKWLKEVSASESPFKITPSDSTAPLEGLSCRWAPLKNSHGVICSILARVRDDIPNKSFQYEKLLAELNEIVPLQSAVLNPVKVERLQAEGLFRAAWKEAGSAYPNGRILGFIRLVFFILLMRFLVFSDVEVAGFRGSLYKKDLVPNSDFRRFDDMLRLVLDCSKNQMEKVIAYLEKQSSEGLIYYGYHQSSEALMTCAVQSVQNNQHIHFIDGAGGGCTAAAQMMKKSMLS